MSFDKFTVDSSLLLSDIPSGKFGVLIMVVCMFWVYTLTVSVVLLPIAGRQIRFLPDGLLVWGGSVNLVRGRPIAPWFLARS